jgi:predicted permease
VALIRHGFWVQRFGADPNAIGRTLNLDGQPVAIAGVLPPDFELPIGTGDVLLPQQLEPPNGPRAFTRFIQVFARLKPGVTPQAAESALEPMLARHTQTLPQVFRVGAKWLVRRVHDRQVGDAPHTAWLLLGSVAALLLIACVNVTNLMLARVAARQREFAVRAALGAGKSRLARLALTESLLLSLGAGGIGLASADALLKIFIAMAPASIPKIQQASLDLRVVAVALALSVLSGAGVGLWPAFSLSRTGSLHGSRTTAIGSRVRFGLVTVQIALAVMMLGGSALLLRSLWKLTSIPLGFESDHVLSLSVTLNAAQYLTPQQQTIFFEDLLDRASHMPATVAAALTDSPFPFGQAMRLTNVEAEGNGLAARGTAFWRRSVTPQYFEALRIPIVRGRSFLDADRKAPEPVVLLTESAERILFPGQSALGHRLKIGANSPWWWESRETSATRA